MRYRKPSLLLGLGLIAVALALSLSAAVASAGNGNASQGKHYGQATDQREASPNSKPLKVNKSESEKIKGQAPLGPAKVGAVRTWIAEDFTDDSLYLKNYTLRGVGNHIEVWVANNLAFPGNDCRNTLGLTTITDAQVQSFIHEFDTNIYPKESEAFSVPPPLDGHKAVLPTLIPNLPSSEYKGEGDNIAVLVDNVRDENFFEPTTPEGQTFVAGFFTPQFNDLTNRNVMTIDAYDWLHRTGANPPDDSSDPAYQACAAELGTTKIGVSHPRDYEGTFAHEYQHLLEHYSDSDEVNWVNEGLSDWAQTLVGYVDPSIPQTQSDADGQIGCFEGYLTPFDIFGGPENSLTVWGDQPPSEILCDYGAAYSFMSMLAGRYGDDFMSALHHDPGNGLQGLQDVLDQFGINKTALDLVHEWAALMALDNQAGTSLTGGSTADYTSNALWSTINWDDPQAYNAPGAPPNGSDYVPLGAVSGLSTFTPTPVAWTEDSAAPGHEGDSVLYSGADDERDEAIVKPVTFGGSGSLTFDAQWNEEEGWDFGFVQVSTDNGATYHSLACTDTTTITNPDAFPPAKENVPGFTGYSGGWKSETCDASAYAGQTVLLSFRTFNDEATLGASDAIPAGFWVDNVNADGALVSDGTNLASWQSPTQVHPNPVHGWTVQLVAYDGAGNAWYYHLPLDSSFHGSLDAAAIQSALGTTATTVGAIVTQDDPTETITEEARYTLTVNGTVQPGG
jgi:hypothetical protein